MPERPLPRGSAAATLPCDFPQLALLRSPIVQRVPWGARPVVAPLFARLCSDVAQHPGNARAWWRLLAFPKLVLFRSPRGGERNVVGEFAARCQLFVQERYDQLVERVNRALELARKRAQPEREPRHERPVFLAEDFDVDLGLSTDVVDVDSLSPAQVRRVMRLAREGALSRACAAMSAAEIAPATDENFAKMQALHPVSAPPAQPPPRRDGQRVERIKPHQLKALLRGFPACSAAGMSGLSPSTLLDFASSTSTDGASAAADVVNLVANGDVPECVQPFLFGARLLALLKKDGGLRPIACGDVFRRCAGKWVVRCLSPQLGPELMPNQVGVGLPNGADVAVQCVRLFVREASAAFAPERMVVVTVDVRNAFNTMSRTAILAAVNAKLPDLLGYALAAYARPSLLCFGDRLLSSSTGTQQGDPLGPVLYALTQSEAVLKAPGVAEALSELDLYPAYLDDLTLGGRYEEVMATLAAFEARAATIGLQVNRTKTVLYATQDVLDSLPPAEPNDLPRKTFADLVVLGVPCCATAMECDSLLRPAVEKWRTLLGMIAQLPQRHIALAMLRFCAADTKVMHLMRGLGSLRHSVTAFVPAEDGDVDDESGFLAAVVRDVDLWAECDAMIAECLRQLVGGVLPERAFEQAVSPCRNGGLGIRQIRPHATVAHAVAMRRAIEQSSAVCAVDCEDALRDYALAAVQSDPTLAKDPSTRDSLVSTLRLGKDEVAARDVQRSASERIELLRYRDRTNSIPPDDRRARAHAAVTTAKYASLWLYSSVFAGAPKLWLDDPTFYAAVRLRLGIPIGGLESLRCTFCQGASLCDPLGDHSLSCMAGGNKTLVHHSVVDQVMILANKAAAQPVREHHPFVGAHRNARLDVVVRMPGSRDQVELCDVAVVHPLGASHLAHGYAFMAAGRGGVADAYEQVKHRHYAAALATVTKTTLRPLVFDSFGGFSSSCSDLVKRLAREWGRRTGIADSTAIRNAMHRLNVEVVRGVARVAGANATVAAARP